MNRLDILVCIHGVADPSEQKIFEKDGKISVTHGSWIINPDDKSGLEEALKLKDKINCNITVLAPQIFHGEDILKETYAMGADNVILFEGDYIPRQILKATVKYIQTKKYKLVITGTESFNFRINHFGSMMAELLQWNNMSGINHIVEILEEGVYVTKNFSDRVLTLALDYPCIVSYSYGVNEPRLRQVSCIMEAYENKDLFQRIKIADYLQKEDVFESPIPKKTMLNKIRRERVMDCHLNVEKSTEEVFHKLLEWGIIIEKYKG